MSEGDVLQDDLLPVPEGKLEKREDGGEVRYRGMMPGVGGRASRVALGCSKACYRGLWEASVWFLGSTRTQSVLGRATEWHVPL